MSRFFYFTVLTLIIIILLSILPSDLLYSQPILHDKIVISRMQTMNDWDLWLMNRDGSGEFKLIDNTYRDTGPCFNPAGTKIVFGRITSTMPVQADVYIINSDGSNAVNLTDLPQLSGPCLSPKFSWDGTKIVFDCTNTPGNSDIYMINPDGTGLTGIVTDNGDDSSPHLSPDGLWVVFMRQITINPEPKAKICKKLISGGSVIDLTSGNYLDETPVFSTDGNFVLFKRGFTQWDLYRIPVNHNPLNDSDLVNMTNQPSWPDGTAMYSWEGDKIVYYSSPGVTDSAEIYLMNPDGSGKQRITYNNFADFDPSFSPKSPSFIKNENGKQKDYILFNNYPNPFNSSTEIYYSVNKNSFVRISVYDIMGKEIAGLVNSVQTQGIYSIIFNADGLSSGIYFCRMTAGNFSDTKKLVLMK